MKKRHVRKKITSERAAAKALKSLIAFAHNNRGTVIELAAALSLRTGTKIYRQYVEKWLHIDAAVRIEPKLGIGLLLIQEGRTLMSKGKAKA